MAETQGLRLTDVDALHAGRNDALDDLQKFVLALFGQFALELGIGVEVVFDRALVAARHEDHFGHPRGGRLLHGVLDERLVDDREHFLRHGLGGRQESRAETVDGKDDFADGLHGNPQLSRRTTGPRVNVG